MGELYDNSNEDLEGTETGFRQHNSQLRNLMSKPKKEKVTRCNVADQDSLICSCTLRKSRARARARYLVISSSPNTRRRGRGGGGKTAEGQ